MSTTPEDSDVIERVTEMLCDLAELGYYRSKEIAEALAAAGLLTPIDETRVWVCGVCGHSPEAHGMPQHSSYQCMYQPILTPSDTFASTKSSDADVAECACTWVSEDRGGGYFETVFDPEPDCPTHGWSAQMDADVAERIAQEIEAARRQRWAAISAEDWSVDDSAHDDGMRDAARIARSHATPPAAATEVVSGYTSHGHRITGVVQTGRPTSVARCGGPGLCTVCSLEAGMATNERHGG